ncbi:threonine synthase [Vineibacter terrae]|uniref:threonine synthase n=1 Tax=Vineibacter terrae TaxID=2586908 RepID=UPI002E2ECAB6|nr:threonine synthase [Vineibacter terrae]HEX2888114.1 threonine synthase [Vineibacter terrae]
MTSLRYISTRQGSRPSSERLTFEEVMLAGLARDGGLYVPESWPAWSRTEIAALRGLSYADLAARVMAPFVGETFDAATLGRLVREAYAGFDAPDVAPLKALPVDDLHLLELFHGPTLAFKDVALQLLGRMLDALLTRSGRRACIIGATSGDTGSAAIEAVRDRAALDIFMLHPRGRVSEVQRRQMTTVLAPNVHNIAIEGTFDDCQDLAKACFNDLAFRDRHRLTAVNSINFARVMAQIVYYFHAALRLGAPERPVSFCVPTGNFGNIYAGYAARAMGLPIERLLIASNSNDILTRFIESGAQQMTGVTPTLSPSMDIQVSSNFERYLFDLFDRDGKALAAAMEGFRATGAMAVSPAQLARARAAFDAGRLDDAGTVDAIAAARRETGETLDPHTAVGYAVARHKRGDRAVPMVVLATAHPAKFPDAVRQATGAPPPVPARLAGLASRPERYETLPNDIGALKRLMDGAAVFA